MKLIITLTYPAEVNGQPVDAQGLANVAQRLMDEWAPETQPAGVVVVYDIIR